MACLRWRLVEKVMNVAFEVAPGLLRSRIGSLRGARRTSRRGVGLLGSLRTERGVRLRLLGMLGVDGPRGTRTGLNSIGVGHPLLALAAHELVEGRVGIGDVVGKQALLLPLRRTGHVKRWQS